MYHLIGIAPTTMCGHVLIAFFASTITFEIVFGCGLLLVSPFIYSQKQENSNLLHSELLMILDKIYHQPVKAMMQSSHFLCITTKETSWSTSSKMRWICVPLPQNKTYICNRRSPTGSIIQKCRAEHFHLAEGSSPSCV